MALQQSGDPLLSQNQPRAISTNTLTSKPVRVPQFVGTLNAALEPTPAPAQESDPVPAQESDPVPAQALPVSEPQTRLAKEYVRHDRDVRHDRGQRETGDWETLRASRDRWLRANYDRVANWEPEYGSSQYQSNRQWPWGQNPQTHQQAYFGPVTKLGNIG